MTGLRIDEQRKTDQRIEKLNLKVVGLQKRIINKENRLNNEVENIPLKFISHRNLNYYAIPSNLNNKGSTLCRS
jgi:Txe/YoeB family toxin of Txe-Axe toxin-antitoxin module